LPSLLLVGKLYKKRKVIKRKKRNKNNKKRTILSNREKSSDPARWDSSRGCFFLLFAPTPGCASFPGTGARRFPHWLASRGPVRSPHVVTKKGKFKKQKQRKLKQRVHTEKIDPHRAITPRDSHRDLLAP
jgi:hypothetical protein